MNTKTTTLFLQEIESTNTYLKEKLLNNSLNEGFTVYAGYQTAGRGQKGNTWEAQAGKNLLFSTILYPRHIAPQNQFLISEIVSLSLKDVLSSYTTGITIKWPNDIYWNDKKIAGILIENGITQTQIDYTILGVGLNLNQDTFISDAPNPVSLTQITGKKYEVKDILMEILDRLIYYYKEYNEDDLHLTYNQSLYRKDQWHWYCETDNQFLAKIQEVKKDGRLILTLPDNHIRSFYFKEIKFLVDK